MITYKDIKDWFEGTSYVYGTVKTSTEFDETKNNVLNFLMNHMGSDIEATFTMHKIKLKKEMTGEVLVIEKNLPEHNHSADNINDII